MSLKNRLGKKKTTSKSSSSSSVRSKFKKRDSTILEKTYNEREERTKMGGQGQTIYNMEILEELNIGDFRPHEGDNYFEILPVSYDPMIPYYLELPVHFSVGFSNDAFICNSRYGRGGKCFRCEQQAKMYRTLPKGNKPTDDIKKLYPTDRALYLIWDRTEEIVNDKEPTYKLSLWAAPKSKIHAEIQLRVRDKRTKETLDISDVSEDGEGRTVNFEYDKKGEFPDYNAITLLNREEAIPEEILDLLDEFISKAEDSGFKHPLEMVIHIPSYEEVKESMLTEMDEEGSEEEEEQEKPAKDKKAKGKKEPKPQAHKDVEEELEALKEELEGMNKFTFKKWCKKNGYEEYADEDKDEILEEILEAEYEKMMEDQIPF